MRGFVKSVGNATSVLHATAAALDGHVAATGSVLRGLSLAAIVDHRERDRGTEGADGKHQTDRRVTYPPMTSVGRYS